MKKLTVLFVLALALSARAALPQPDLIAQIHFVGGEKISVAKNFAAFTNEFSSPEARALAAQTLDKLSRAPGAWFKSKMAAGADDGAVQLRPLLDDLLKSEWIFEARETANGSPEFALAIRLSPERAQLWSKNLADVLQNWTRLGISKDKNGRWELRKHEPPNLFRFEQRGDWTLIDCGENKLSLGNEIFDLLKSKNNLSETDWLAADINWPRLAQWFPIFGKFNLPETQLTVSAPDDNLRVNGNFFFAQSQNISLAPWKLPATAIRQPFVSFTAARGFASWLDGQFSPLKVSPSPDQIFIWALPNIAFQTFAAVPVPDSAAALDQVYAQLQPRFAPANSPKNFLMPITLERTNGEITFIGAPFIAPYIRTLNDPAGQFLLGGFFPNPGRAKSLPAELFQRLAEKNLVYYHWEITAEREPQLLNLTQLGLVLTDRKQLDPNSAAFKWMQKIAPSLGNNVTEIFENAPDRFSFTRKAPGGLTAFELLALANWLEATNFPGCDLKLPPRVLRPRTRTLHSPQPALPAPH